MRNLTEAAALGRKYLEASNPDERRELAAPLDMYTGDLNRALERIRPQVPDRGETGWLLSREFRTPRLAGRYREQPFTLYVPKDYDASQARGLLIFLHGGGQGRGDVGRHLYEHQPQLNALFEQCGRIVCYPSAPPHDRCWARWQLPEADAYIEDLIEEVSSLYRVDPHNMILGGFSMGGMGAYHMAHRFADRFFSLLAGAGHWDFACWRSLMGSTLWIVHGINDAVLFRRRHGTDIEFARLARMRLEQAGVPCVYREHYGGHNAGDALWVYGEWLDWSRDRRRDPFFPHVVAVTPRGLSPWSDWRRHKVPLAAYENSTDFHSIPDAPHARWVTIDGVGKEAVLFDMVAMSDCRDEVEEDWNSISLTLRRKHVPGGVVEAFRMSRREIEVTPKNVAGFTLWLHPDMADLDDVCVRVRGKERFRGALRPSLATALESYLRRRDWGMIYPAKVSVAADETWETGDQLKVTPR
jgi:pimeloyl-ACP methyl ester carboxylesterase